MEVTLVSTQPIEGQKTGTSGLRKKVAHILSHSNYIENWLQSLMNALDGAQNGKSFVLGGDGRYLNDEAMISAIEILYANGVDRIIIGQGGLLSTPSVSNLIRKRGAFGGVIMTASHNPAGADGDWGVKFNSSNGEPAPEKVTDKIYAASTSIREIKRAKTSLKVSDLSVVGSRTFPGNKSLEIVDSVDDYIDLMKSVFDFDAIRSFIQEKSVSIVFDGMHAVTGIYGRRIFVDELGLDAGNVLQNANPLPDFGKGHPDPNLVYAHDLVHRMMKMSHPPVFGAASDGDGDRNMIMGANWFVTPSDSLAIIAHYAKDAIPYFAKHGLRGVARSMPTSRAVDVVAAAKKFSCYQTPTGWKYFGNLMDGGLANLCGEESFGTGADHIREKDGLWAVLAWLSILEYVNRDTGSQLIDVRAVNERHWDMYGRHYYSRCDYEECESLGANQMMDHIRASLGHLKGTELMNSWTVESAEEYEYKDPVDGSEAKKQGFIIAFTNGSRLVYRLSGTGSAGATIRVYMEQYVKDWRATPIDSLDKGPLMTLSKSISQIEKFTGRTAPTVIT